METDHIYISTACQHRLHDKCRLVCKYCENACHCSCHEGEQKRALSWDQLSNYEATLLNIIDSQGTVAVIDLERNYPALMHLQGGEFVILKQLEEKNTIKTWIDAAGIRYASVNDNMMQQLGKKK